MPEPPIPAPVDHLFRHAAGQMVAALARLVGPHRLDLAEEVVQDAMIRAIETWPYRGVPENPRGWLFQVARNRALDILRREKSLQTKLEAAGIVELAPRPPSVEDDRLGDEELAMMFMCCHPDLPPPAQLALTLKLVSGFSVREIADALLSAEEAVTQRLVRAKRQIRDENIPLEIPSGDALLERLPRVLEVIYLLFNEGYEAHGGESLVRADLCGEAIRLARSLAETPRADRPATHALLALMLLQASRLPARTDALGDLLLLAEQDRARWDQALIAEGLRHLERAAAGDAITSYHLEAAIAAGHAIAPSVEGTDWPHLLRLYDDLLALKPSPIVALNRAVVLAMVEGAEAGLAALAPLGAHPAMAAYFLYPAVCAGLAAMAGRTAEAAASYRAALALRCSAPERRFIEKRLKAVEGYDRSRV